ncbi:MAG TPA: transcription-repair coupling factor [Thermoanaerobaculia bacterium]|jgi:transcription-repair coupling factor (superfamily II helicase)|nr:transcription-repair coupling factor [Thermoanaerobaculia bacterium]
MSDRFWQEASQKLRASPPFRALSARLGDVVRLPAPAAAWVAELLAEDLGRPLLVVVPREADALAWLEAVQLFGHGRAVYFPAPSLTPYQETETSLLVRAQESVALDRIVSGSARTVVATPRALFRRLPARADFAAAALDVKPGDDLPIDELVRHLDRFGYHRTDLVYEIGEYAVRGGLVDFFPPGEDAPIRLDLFGDTIEAIRWFDAQSQRSEDTLDSIRILPLLLFPGGPNAAAKLADLLGALGGDDLGPEAAERLAALRQAGGFPGWENYLPLLGARTGTLVDALAVPTRDSKRPLVLAVDPPALAAEVEHHASRLAADWSARRDHRRLAISPEDLEWPAAAVEAQLAGAEVRIGDLVMSEIRDGARVDAIDFAASTTDLFHGQLPRFPQEVATARSRGERCVIVAPAAHHTRMEDLLAGREIQIGRNGVELAAGDLSRGFRLPAAGIALYGEQQILPQAKLQRRASKSRFGPFLAGLRDLKVGDYVVHSDHGIGRFIALRSVRGGVEDTAHLPPALRDFSAPAAIESEVMEIEYTSGKRLLLPLSRLDQVQKYSGIEGVAPRLDQLGGTSWNKAKSKVKSSLRDMADGLLKLYAERQLARAPAMGGEEDSDWVRQFAAAFAYEETADQHEAIAAIRQDLRSERPMDRLLCGDVGYGKTEVAMRAAFQAVDAGFQVAVLAPTTILADQHLETFRKRFAGFPVTIEMISRFRSGPETKALGKRLKEGGVDILIGTHRLLSKDIEMPKLGLMIVDEEQRFGVAQKERLKQAKKNVHVLAMSATPVPRTLQLSLAGVRDLSVIETPPKDRMAVETAILPFNPEVIREAIEHEIERGGQVYYVYNRVETIEKMLTYLRDLVPGVRVTVGHGQLEEAELSRRMHAFTERQFDVLLATTIIENGIDIPNVNTMIVHRAERFGLAQLYQLRGRVGRSNQLAYCYLLVPSDRILSESARKRLAAIREFTDLGAGFRIAARDLEIRGAGNLLGSEQSGQIAAVGIETYLKLLEEAVRELRGEAIEEAPSAQIDLPVAMSIPQGYVADANLRMEIYRKIAAAEQSREEVLAELADRFGPPPDAVRTLVEVAALKRVAESLRVQSIASRGRELTIRLRRDARVDVDRLIDLVSTLQGASFSPTGVLTLPVSSGAEALATATATLQSLAH